MRIDLGGLSDSGFGPIGIEGMTGMVVPKSEWQKDDCIEGDDHSSDRQVNFFSSSVRCCKEHIARAAEIASWPDYGLRQQESWIELQPKIIFDIKAGKKKKKGIKSLR